MKRMWRMVGERGGKVGEEGLSRARGARRYGRWNSTVKPWSGYRIVLSTADERGEGPMI